MRKHKRCCENCFWADPVRLPIDKEKYGEEAWLCLNSEQTLRIVVWPDRAGCESWLWKEMIYDDNKKRFVHRSVWTSFGQSSSSPISSNIVRGRQQ